MLADYADDQDFPIFYNDIDETAGMDLLTPTWTSS
jgi:hypothetical protein